VLFDFLSKLKQAEQKSTETTNEILNLLKKGNTTNYDNSDFLSNISNTNFSFIFSKLSENNNTDTFNQFSENNKSIEEQIVDILKDITSVPQSRIKYYNQLEELYESFPYARRIINLYVSSICRVNPITNSIFNYVKNSEIEDYIPIRYREYYELMKKNIQFIILYFDLEQRFKNIIPNVLKLGNVYAEIIDKKTILNKNLSNIIYETENYVNELSDEESKVNLLESYSEPKKISELNNDEELLDSIIKNLSDILIEVDISDNYMNLMEGQQNVEDEYITFNEYKRYSDIMLYENEQILYENEEDNDVSGKYYIKLTSKHLQRIDIIFHQPHNVLPISNNDDVLGYLVFEPSKFRNPSTYDTVSKYFNYLFNPSKQSDEKLQDLSTRSYNKLINYLIQKLQKKIEEIYNKETNSNIDISVISTNKEKLQEVLYYIRENHMQIYHMFTELLYKYKFTKVKVRFVPADRMVNFIIDTTTYPVGQSIIEPLLFYSRLYLITLITNIIAKVSRSSLIRRWIIDAGLLKQYDDLFQQLKRDVKNNVITIDSFGSLKTIPKIITDFRDIATYQINGRSFVDFTLQQLGDPSIKIDDLEYLRNEMISLSQIPSPYLGLVDTVELREQLVTANILWAENISNYQYHLTQCFNELIDKIYYHIFKDVIYHNYTNKENRVLLLPPTKFYKVTLNQPLTMQIQYLDAVISYLGNIIQLLSNVPQFNIVKLLQKFIPEFNIEEFMISEEDIKKSELQSLVNQQGQQGNEQGGEGQLSF